MHDLGTLGGRASYATAINDRGEVVGWAETDEHEHFAMDSMWTPGDAGKGAVHGGTRHAFVWRKGKMRDLGTLGGTESYVAALNSGGVAVGRSTLRGDHDGHGFVWQKGRLVDVGDLGGGYSNAVAVSAEDQVLGQSTDKTSLLLTYLWENGRMRSLGINDFPVDINDQGQVVTEGSLWDQGRIVSFPLNFSARDLNEHGQVVGQTLQRDHAVFWENRKTTDLGTLPGGKESGATAINNRGQIVGWSSTRDGRRHAVLWTLRQN